MNNENKYIVIKLLESFQRHMDNSEFELAINDLTEAIKSDPEQPDFYFERAIAYDNLHKTNEALADYNKYLSLSNYATPEEEYNKFIKYREDWKSDVPKHEILSEISNFNKTIRESVINRKIILEQKTK